MKVRGIVAAAAALTLMGALGACSLIGGNSSPTRNPTAPVSSSQMVDAFSLRVGDCIVSKDLGDTFSTVPTVPCTQAHDAEITYIYDLKGTIFDQATIDDDAQPKCEQAAIDYVGAGYADVATGLDWTYFGPTSDSWKNGDREIDCLVYTTSGTNDLTSSVKGKG